MGIKIILIFIFSLNSRVIYFKNNLGNPGWNLTQESESGCEVVFSIPALKIRETTINGELMHVISVPGVLLFWNEEKAPNLPVSGRYIAIPQGAKVNVEIIECRQETLKNLNIAPVPILPLETDLSPLKYEKDP